MDNKIFNVDKTDYEEPALFLGQEDGLFDTVNKRYPKIWKLYKTLRKMDWDANEFDYSSCNSDFKTCNPSVYNMMIKTLAWQWEADSVAARSLLPIIAPMISSSELFALYAEITKNELVHAETYSEIVRTSFDNPEEVLKEVLAVKESLSRLSEVGSVMKDVYTTSHKIALNQFSSRELAMQAVLFFETSMLALERIQFMSSFAVTFSICNTGLFNPIGKAVQKIAQDELEVHVEAHKEVITILLKDPKWKEQYELIKPAIKNVLDEITKSEEDWVEYLHSTGDELVGTNKEMLKDWSLFCAKDVYHFLKIESDNKFPKTNPLKWMERWLDISKTQPSPQEEDNAQYKINSVRRTDEGISFEVDF